MNRIWKKKNSNTRKLRKNSELQVRIKLKTLWVLVRVLQLSYIEKHILLQVTDSMKWGIWGQGSLERLSIAFMANGKLEFVPRDDDDDDDDDTFIKVSRL